jgi:hypothetical protein
MWWSLWVAQALAEEPARVVVLQWPETATDYQTGSLRKKLEGRVGKGAAFAPELDLYQPGRTEPDASAWASLSALRASPSSEILSEVVAQVEQTMAMTFDSLTEQEWVQRAADLRFLAGGLWFVDRLELREPIFLLYVSIGKAAENANQGTPPYYEVVSGKAVNYYWYLAATLAHQDPSLLSKITDLAVYQTVVDLEKRLDSREFQPLTLSFALGSEFDARAFATEYTLYLNGFEVNLTNAEGLLEVPLGVSDVFLQRRDGGYGPSIRIERQTAEKGFEFPMQTARKRMGLDLIEQLMENPSKCIPDLAGDLAQYLAVYAKLHPEAEIYVSVPQFGSTSNKKLWLWHWDRTEGRLELSSRKDPCP